MRMRLLIHFVENYLSVRLKRLFKLVESLLPTTSTPKILLYTAPISLYQQCRLLVPCLYPMKDRDRLRAYHSRD